MEDDAITRYHIEEPAEECGDSCCRGIGEFIDGDYVLYSDYRKAEADRDRWKAEAMAARGYIKEMEGKHRQDVFDMEAGS